VVLPNNDIKSRIISILYSFLPELLSWHFGSLVQSLQVLLNHVQLYTALIKRVFVGIDVDREQVWETDAAQDTALITSHHTHYETLDIAQQRARLPIYKHRRCIYSIEASKYSDSITYNNGYYVQILLIGRELLWLVEQYRTVVLVGQTGSGKTTRM
jgi:Flp pilus assembly CpaF family ATPase